MHDETTDRQSDRVRRLQFPVWRDSIQSRRSGIPSIALHFGVEATVVRLVGRSVGRLPLYSPLFHERERHHFDRKRSRADGKGAIIRNNLPQSPTRQAIHLSFPISESPSATSMIDSSKISPKIYCLPSCAFITIGCRKSLTVAIGVSLRRKLDTLLRYFRRPIYVDRLAAHPILRFLLA